MSLAAFLPQEYLTQRKVKSKFEILDPDLSAVFVTTAMWTPTSLDRVVVSFPQFLSMTPTNLPGATSSRINPQGRAFRKLISETNV